MDFVINTANISMDDINKPVSLNEKMVISLCSSLENLEQYFSASSKLLMRLMIGNKEIGFAEMSMKNLVPTTNKEKFCSLEEDSSVTIENPCFLRGFITREVPISPNGHQPHIYLKIKLKHEQPDLENIGQGEGQMKVMEIGQSRLVRSSSYTILNAQVSSEYNIPIVESQAEDNDNDMNRTTTLFSSTQSRGIWQASGDIDEEMNVKKLIKEIKAPTGQSQLLSVSASHFKMPSTHVSKECQSEQLLHDSSTQFPEEMYSSYHNYALEISVQSIIFYQLPMEEKCFLRFYHQKADIICKPLLEINVHEPNDCILLQDVNCKLRFVSNPGEINRLLLAWPPKINICDSSERKIAFAVLNMEPLLAEKMGKCSYSVKLLDPKTSEEVGILKVAMVLEDFGQQQAGGRILKPLSSDQSLGPPILDDRIAYKIVEELEDWKERQQILFKAELKKKEKAYLTALSEDWKQKHKNQEQKLYQNVEQCRLLAHSLDETTNELRVKTYNQNEREKELNSYKEIIEEKHKIIVMELKAEAERLQHDLNLKILALESDKEQQEMKLKKVEKENAILKETIVAQQKDLEEIKKNSLTKEQTASLMNEM
ncbi:hypothetical protein L9F63_023051, partial [Diploptera punctata]